LSLTTDFNQLSVQFKQITIFAAFLKYTMAKFHTLRVKEVRKETKDCISISFEIPNDLKQEYSYKQGQYLTLKLNLNGEEIRRSYSVCSSPVINEDIRVAVKKVPMGKASTYLNDSLTVGESIEVMTPMGKFYTELNPSNAKTYSLFAAGSGITPMLSIIKSILHTETNSKINLVYGNYNEESSIFRNELLALQNSSNGKFIMHEVFEIIPNSNYPAYLSGMMKEDLLSNLVKQMPHLLQANEIFVCGPSPMMANVLAVCNANGITKNIHVEYFTTVLEDIKKAEEKAATSVSEDDFNGDAEVKVIVDGVEVNFKLNTNGDNILDAALDAGADVPFSCKGGVCSTCRAKVIEGKAEMDMNYSLDDGEVEDGFILSCQAHPRSAKIVVDFDC
jgi:ring-1,2-phenylacetyl-CoA epoxidase subunit PaaE